MPAKVSFWERAMPGKVSVWERAMPATYTSENTTPRASPAPALRACSP